MTGSVTGVSFPARCAVAVVYGEHLVSQVYPASVPIEVFLDDVVELLDEDLKRRGADGLDPSVAYRLHRADGTRLDITKTLDELGVEDGATIVVLADDGGESFEPHYESLSTALARTGRALFAPVTARTAAQAATAILLLGVVFLLAAAGYVRIHHDTWAPGAVAVTAGLLLAAGAARWRRTAPDVACLRAGLAWSAAPLLAFGIGAVAPGQLSGAHALAGAVALAVAVGAAATLTGEQLTLASTVVTVCVVVGLIGASRMWRPVPAQWLGMCALIALLVVLSVAPTVALRVARIRPPHFGSITGRDLFRRGEDMATDTVVPVQDDPADDPAEDPARDTTPRGALIAEAARRANAVLTGICIAAALMLPVAAWFTLMPARPRGNWAAVLVLLFVVVFISRGRAFADRKQAVAVVLGGCTAFFAGVLRYVTAVTGDEPVLVLLCATLTLGVFAAAALAAALLVPGSRFTPLVRMAAEWIELVAIVIALPLAAWLGGLFAWVRMR